MPGTCPWRDDPLGRDVGLFRYPKGAFETDWLTDRSVDYLRSRQNRPEPWFLFTSYLKPHSPSVEPEPHFDMYDPKAMPIPKLPPDGLPAPGKRRTPDFRAKPHRILERWGNRKDARFPHE